MHDDAKDNAQLIAAKTHRAAASMNDTAMTDLTSLITFLIAEIKETLHTRIDLLNEKVDLYIKENKDLKAENERLRELTSSQEQTITDLKSQKTSQQSSVNNPAAPIHALQFMNTTPQKQRGIKAFNLIFTCPDVSQDDPKQVIENILLTKFNRRCVLNSVQLITREQQQPPQNADDSSTSNEQKKESRILVTFNSIWDVRVLYKDRITALRDSQIYISEDLYRDESHVFYLARSLKKQKMIFRTWTEEGNVYVIEKEGELPRILTKDDPILSLQQKKNKQQIDENKFPENTLNSTVSEKNIGLPKTSQSESMVMTKANQTSQQHTEISKTAKKRARKKQNEEQDG